MDQYGELVSEFAHYLVVKGFSLFLEFIDVFDHNCKGLNIVILDLHHFDVHLLRFIHNHKGILIILRPDLDFLPAFEHVDFDVLEHRLIQEYLLFRFNYLIILIPAFAHFLDDFS